MVTELLISLDFVVALALPNPQWVGEMRGKHREQPFLLDRFPHCLPPHTKPSPTICLLPAGKPASSQSQEVRILWGQVEGQQDPEPSGCLFLGACGHCRPCWVYTAVLADPSPVAVVQGHPCARGPTLAIGQSFDAKLLQPDATLVQRAPTPVSVRLVSPCLSPAPATPSVGFQGGGGLTSCCRNGSQF